MKETKVNGGEGEKSNRLVLFINTNILPFVSHALIAIFIGIFMRIFAGEGDAMGLGILLIWFVLLLIPSIPYGFGMVPVLNKKMELGRLGQLYYLYLIFFLIGFLGYNP